MSHETYDEYLTRGGGPEVDPARVEEFKAHRRTCPVCSAPAGGDFAYLVCADGLRLARAACRPIDRR